MTATIRYIVDDVEEAIEFYRTHLGFEVVMHPAPAFAMLSRGDLQVALNTPGAGGGGSAGGEARPGGWNRFQIQVDDLETKVGEMRSAGVSFRGDIVVGVGGNQILAEDPSGNPVELFQSTR